MNRILIIDTETSDLPNKLVLSDEQLKELGYDNINDVPLAYQLSYIYDNGKKRSYNDAVGKPLLPISIASSEITHVTNSDIEELTIKEDGTYLTLKETEAFIQLKDLIEKIDNKEIYLVGHNAKYDLDILKREGLDLSNCKIIDTLQLSKVLDKDLEANRLTYILYAKNELLKATRSMMELKQVTSVAKIKPLNAHNSLFDTIATSYLLSYYKDKYLELNPHLSIDEVYEELHKISITPFIMETIPFGTNKGKAIKDLKENEILWILKMDIDEMNFKYSLEEQLNTFGGYKEVLKRMSNYDIEKLLNSNAEYFTNKELKEMLENELKSRDQGIVTLGFGKNGNDDIQTVSTSYLEWVQKNNGNPITMKKVTDELNRRNLLNTTNNNEVVETKIEIKKEDLNNSINDVVKDTSDILENFLNN